MIEKVMRSVDYEYSNHQVYPSKNNIFRAFDLLVPEDLKVVVIGQDPYHGEGQAHGLSFSVEGSQKIPPSLRNIFKEIQNNFEDFEIPNHGDLSKWAKQGVLLLNRVLTVRAGKPGSHKDLGWQEITSRVVELVSSKSEHIVFFLWGSHALSIKKHIIQPQKHLILESVHPSPLSAYRGFFGNQHFVKTQKYLKQHHGQGVSW